MFGYVDIDREITGNYGEDSCGEEVVACTCDECNEPMAVINEDGETEYIDTIDTTYTEVEQQEPDDFGEQQPNVPTEEADEPMSLDDFD